MRANRIVLVSVFEKGEFVTAKRPEVWVESFKQHWRTETDSVLLLSGACSRLFRCGARKTLPKTLTVAATDG